MLEPTITWSCAYANDFEPVLALMQQGAYPTDGWVGDISIDDIVEDGFETLHRGAATKLLVSIGGELS
jgi:(R,R)-butanediol dehydrogenase/meso-butanediol dehydrogenase/diacetyl reductase